MTVRFGLITRIALLVIGIEVASFSALGWFYTDRFSTAAEDRLRHRLLLVGEMIARSELPVSAVSVGSLIGDLVGAPYLDGFAVGGSGHVIVASDAARLGRRANSLEKVDPVWIDASEPDEQIVAGPGTLTGIRQIQGAASRPTYTTVITVSTSELQSQKRSIALWGLAGSAVFVLLSSAGIVLVAQRLITRRIDASRAILRRVGNGALDARIPVTAEDELGQLQHGINAMTAKLAALVNQHRRNEEEMATILDAIGDGVLAVGPDGRVLRCNPSATAILGAAEGMPIAQLLPEATSLGGEAWWRAPASLTAQRRLHIERSTADREPRSIELGHGPITDPDGTVIGAVLVLQEVTARKRAEKELRDAVERLTVSNSELERFAYIASHDLQEPLRTITAFTQLLDRRLGASLSAEDRENFGFVVAAAKRMSLLISDLLAFSRVNSRGEQFSPVALSQVCGAAIENLRESIAESQADIVVEPLPVVMGDTTQLMQVFQNLIGNAIKFRRPDVPLRVDVSAERQGSEWIVSVADNGIGVAETNQDIFEIFRRLHPASVYPGTGVGLAICKRIAQRHRGRIWFDSTPGSGATFHIALPAQDA